MQTTFKRGHKFDLFDMFTISPSEVQELFWKEFKSKVDKNKPNLDNLKVMLESEIVELNAMDDHGQTPLHRATMHNSLALAELLISSGAEVNAKNKWGQMPLHLAAIHNSLALAQLLISSGAEVNNGGFTPLHYAAFQNSLEVAQLLISSGADLEAKDDRGRTPLYWAASDNRLKVAELLFKHSSKKNREDVLNRYRDVCGHKRLVKSLEKIKV